jgi:hypothetical protein
VIEKKDAALAALKDKTKVSSAPWMKVCFSNKQHTFVTRKMHSLYEYAFCDVKY